MASKNVLLGHNADIKELASRPPANDKPQERAPAWRFHKDCPEGIVVKTDAMLDKLDAEGWKDHPGKTRPMKNFMHIWEAEQAANDEVNSSNSDHSETDETEE